MSENQGTRRRLPRPATVLAAIAVFAVLAGTATAAKTVINGSQIKKGTITNKQIKNKTLSASKLSPGAVSQLKGNQGPRGPQGEKGERGERGAQGEKGAQGPAGIVTPLFGSLGSQNIGDGEDVQLISLPVNEARTYVINAKTNLFAVQDTAQVDCRIEIGNALVDLAQWNVDTVNSRQPIPLQAVAAASPGQTIKLLCSFEDGNGSAAQSKLTAIPVA